MKQLNTFLQQDGAFRYIIAAPDWVADREDRSHYEKDRFASMEANLKKGDVLFDVGSELGWQSAIYARFVGPENMCLFEHVPELWPTIREIWDLNSYVVPRFTLCGFVSNRSTDGAICNNRAWPREACELRSLNSFDTWPLIHTNPKGEEVTVDDVVKYGYVTPTAITIDVEGAELRVLKGAVLTLLRERPLVWVSLHPDKRLATFGASKQRVREFMKALDYEEQYLGVDHEEHSFFYPRGREVVFVASPWGTRGKRDVTFEEAMPGWQDAEGMPYAKEWGAS